MQKYEYLLDIPREHQGKMFLWAQNGEDDTLHIIGPFQGWPQVTYSTIRDTKDPDDKAIGWYTSEGYWEFLDSEVQYTDWGIYCLPGE